MRNEKELHKAIVSVLTKSKEPIEEAKKPLHPNQQKLDVHEPEKDELTSKDFKKLRSDKAKLGESNIEEVDETITIVHKPIDFQVKEFYNFGDYLQAAKKLVGEEEAIHLANEKFKQQDTSIFEDVFVEEFSRSDIDDKVKAHQNAGHKVTMPKYSTSGGKLRAEYIVTDKDTGNRRKFIHHGSTRKVENMGTAGKKDED